MSFTIQKLIILSIIGFMYFLGLQMSTASAILLSVGLGLAVDYSVHIAHAFMRLTVDSEDERVQKVITEVGPAVFNGGFSTFLAFAILVFAKSFPFIVFFKMFFLISVFGLHHGLIFLPAFLSKFGINHLNVLETKTEGAKEKAKKYGTAKM